MKRLSAKTLFPFCFILCCQHLAGQTNIGGTINTYVDVTIVGPCANKITVSNSSGFTSGNSVIIIQMQGATMESANSLNFGDLIAPNSAGLWEKAIIQTVAGNVITLTKNLLNSYNVSGKVQMILLPTYSSANVSSTLTGASWNGTTGGVLALEVSGTLTLNANIDASGIGFRGGDDDQNCTTTCNPFLSSNNFYYPLGDWQAGLKGEGIAAFISGRELGKGKQVNGGGGGKQAANGGAGGGNYGSGGGGGANNDPGGFFSVCKGNNNHGLGGISLGYIDRNHLFLGGGGGAGHGDNGVGPSCPGDGDSGEGGNGGGIVIIIANSIIGNGFGILSIGNAGDNSQGDGAGGGGAGGVIFINANTISGSLTVDVSGGDGGDSNNTNANRCFGTGGGGGAGIVLTNLPLTANVNILSNGGTRGFITNSNNAGCNNTSVASDGTGTTDVLTGSLIRQSTTPSAAGCGLPVTFIHFTGKSVLEKIELHWATATEVDADYFAIERSSNNIDFTEVGRIPAVGNTSWRTDYHFVDSLPYPGRNYYRIRQADVTGYEKFTNVILVRPETRRLLQNIYPNPVGTGGSLRVSFTDAEKDHRLTLLDISGRTMAKWERRRQPETLIDLPLPALNAGVYLLVVTTPERRETHKIVVE